MNEALSNTMQGLTNAFQELELNTESFIAGNDVALDALRELIRKSEAHEVV